MNTALNSLNKDRFPNFLMIGTGKSGSTSLYNYLKQHPDIFMTDKKEPGYFSFRGEKPVFQGPKDDIYVNNYVVSDLGEYLNLFNHAGTAKIRGEASMRYLATSGTAEFIKNLIPDVKMLAVLRNPADRAFSSYMMAVRDGRESVSFLEALEEESVGKRRNWSTNGYFQAGLYFQHLSEYYQLFDRSQLKICLFEDLKSPDILTKEIFQFLNVDTGFTPDFSTKYNASGKPKFKPIHSIVTKLDDLAMLQYRKVHDQFFRFSPGLFRFTQNIYRKSMSNYYQLALNKTEIDRDIRYLLLKRYRDDIIKLQDLIQRDLSHWLHE